MLSIKKNDEVMVIAGQDKGKKGKVIKVLVKERKLIIEDINVRTKHKRRTQTDPGGEVNVEMPIDISNVMLFDKKVDKPTRFKISVKEDGKKVRISTKSGEVI